MNSLHLYSFVFSSFFIFFFWFDNFSFLLSVVVLILTTSFNQFYFSLFLREDRIILSNLLRSILLALNLILVYFRIFEDLKLLQVVLISQLSVSIIIFLIYGRFYFYPLRLSLAFLKNNFRMKVNKECRFFHLLKFTNTICLLLNGIELLNFLVF